MRRGISGVTILLLLATGVGLYLAFRHVQPLLAGSGCDARTTSQGIIALDTGQAGIAATIAGVAHTRHSRPAPSPSPTRPPSRNRN